MEHIKFSVIIPVYNTEKYLERCINSVLEQNYEGIEIILVNDGSTDDSLRICENYKKKFSEIILLNQSNKGQGAARNRGIEVAEGDYILFLDSDDYWEPDKLGAIVNILKSQKIDLLAVKWNHYDLDGRFISTNGINEQLVTGKVFNGCQFIEKWGCVNPLVWQYVYSKDLIQRNKLYFMEGVFHEDCEYITRVYLKAEKIYNSDIVFYNYCYSPTSTMQKKNIKKCKDLLLVSDSVKNTANRFEGRIKKQLEKYASYLAWTAVASCVRQNYNLRDFLFMEGNRSKIIHTISGFNKYSLVKILLYLHLDMIVVLGCKLKMQIKK